MDLHDHFDGKKFEVTYRDKKNNTISKDIFDYVVVSTGHFSVPFIPEWVPDPQDLAAKAINLFDRVKDNVTEDLATKSVKEIEKEIATLKIATNAKREVDPSVLTGDINIDIQVNGVGIYDRKLGVLINEVCAKTNEILHNSK